MAKRWNLPGTARAGLLAICAAIVLYVGVSYWVSTRTLFPVDMPVAVTPGHIRTGNFKINVDAYFSVQIVFAYRGDLECSDPNGIRTSRLTSIGGLPFSTLGAESFKGSGITAGTYLGTFRGKPGIYNLDIEVLSVAQNLDGCKPSLEIQASYPDFIAWESIQSNTSFFCVVGALVGIVIVLVSIGSRFRERAFEGSRLRIFDAEVQAVSLPTADLKPERSIPLLLSLGILAVAAGMVVLVATIRWYDSRNFILVDKPVSLGPGHIKTGDFTTNLKGTYGIALRVNEFYDLNCPEYAVLKTRWVVMRDGLVIAHRERGEYPWLESNTPIQGTDLYFFDAEPGTYNLDVEVLSDGRCLNVREPRLRVELIGWDRAAYNDLSAKLQSFSLLTIGTGLALLFAYRTARLRQKPRALPLSPSFPDLRPAWGITGLRSKRSLTGPARTVNPRMNLPTVALACSLTWFTCFAPICVLISSGHVSSKGLLVSLPRIGVPPASILSGPSAPLVTVDGKDLLYLNYKQTSWEELPAALDQALRGLPVRVVYFEGDSQIPFMEAARVIDIIEGLDAKPILLTPGSKSENQKSPGSAVSPSRRII